MFISALLIVGGLLVVILGLSGEILDATTGIIAGTVLFVFGLVVLRRQKSESGHLESNGSNERPAVSNAADQTSSQPDEQVAPSTVPVDEVDQDEEDTISTGESTAQQSEDPEGSGGGPERLRRGNRSRPEPPSNRKIHVPGFLR